MSPLLIKYNSLLSDEPEETSSDPPNPKIPPTNPDEN